MMTAPPPIVLASQSRTRRALLDAAGVPFVAQAAPMDERAIEAPLIAAGMGPAALAAALAEAKAIAVSRKRPEAVVVGADQTLELDGVRWTKPANAAEARSQLQRLSGRTHALHTAIATAHSQAIVWRYAQTAQLTMRALSDAFIDRYLERVGEAATASIGAYQIEGFGIRLFEKIEGDMFAILGLPLLPLLAFLRGEGAIE